MRSSSPTIASCLALISLSLAALLEGNESMKLVRSRSLASSSSNFSLQRRHREGGSVISERSVLTSWQYYLFSPWEAAAAHRHLP
jgi:hypothetical protein